MTTAMALRPGRWPGTRALSCYSLQAVREIAASRSATGNVPSIARPEGVAMISEQRNDTGDEAFTLRHARSGVFRLLEGG